MYIALRYYKFICVDVTYTDDQGRFSRYLYASKDGDYYARLRLFSAEVQLEDACNSSVWSIDTQHQTNRGGLIEVGSLQISRDGGTGTPMAAVWQGFRDAALEFRETTQGETALQARAGWIFQCHSISRSNDTIYVV